MSWIKTTHGNSRSEIDWTTDYRSKRRWNSDKKGTIRTYVDLQFTIGEKQFNERFYITGSWQTENDLRTSLAEEHNPLVDWKNGTLPGRRTNLGTSLLEDYSLEGGNSKQEQLLEQTKRNGHGQISKHGHTHSCKKITPGSRRDALKRRTIYYEKSTRSQGNYYPC